MGDVLCRAVSAGRGMSHLTVDCPVRQTLVIFEYAVEVDTQRSYWRARCPWCRYEPTASSYTVVEFPEALRRFYQGATGVSHEDESRD